MAIDYLVRLLPDPHTANGMLSLENILRGLAAAGYQNLISVSSGRLGFFWREVALEDAAAKDNTDGVSSRNVAGLDKERRHRRNPSRP